MKTDRFLLEELPKIYKILRENQRQENDFQSSFQFQYEELDTFEVLNHVNCERVFYFKSKYGNFSFLGLGQSKNIKAHELNNYLKENPNQYIIAAFLFELDLEKTDFILPEWIFVTENGKTHLTINQSLEHENFSSPNLFFNTNFDLNLYDPMIPPWLSFEESPEHDQWRNILNECDKLFNSGELEKIVMSRKKIFDYLVPIEPIAFFKSIMKKNNFAQTSYAIFHQTNYNQSYISLTPEKLFSIRNNLFESISLAASAPRGVTEEEDIEFEKLLNSSEKLTREHNFVTEEILRKISHLTSNIEVSPLQTMKLPYIQHRSIPITAKLKDNIGTLDLVMALHPTPAVGGLPWDNAKSKIKELEIYDRGQYAAPIGIISSHNTELAVGIRCAFIDESRLTLVGGAGIVKGSNAEEEWSETNTKMNPFLKVVNNE